MQPKLNVKEGGGETDLPLEQISRIIFEQDKFLARCAQMSYLKQGRGALLLDLSASADEIGLVKTSFVYLAEDSAALASLGDCTDQDVMELIRSYDPERAVVLLVRFHGGRVAPIQLEIPGQG